jgi:hypothetical protein
MPNTVVIGAMKCGTDALHEYLDEHPDIAMSIPKELNFFLDSPLRDDAVPEHTRYGNEVPKRAGRCEPYAWSAGNWHRGGEWYARHFPAHSPVRGESSPGYTSPRYPDVAGRMAAVIPDARLVYIVRDPLERALSQYQHHRRDGAETRALEDALLDPHSQYISRGRYYERLMPFLEHFARDHVAIVSREELLGERRTTVRSLFEFLGVDRGFWSDGLERLWNTSNGHPVAVGKRLRRRFGEALADDLERLREIAGSDFPRWSM